MLGVFNLLNLIDFYETKYSTRLVGEKEVSMWIKGLVNVDYDNLCVLSDENRCIVEIGDFYQSMGTILQQKYPAIKEILEIGKGKIAICGLNILHNGSEYGADRFNFYFHSCTIEEAQDILIRALDILEIAEPETAISFDEDNYLCIANTTSISIDYRGNIDAVNFRCIIHKDKGEMLRNVGPPIYQHGYDSDGYFTTFFGGITSATRTCPININFESYHADQLNEEGVNLIILGGIEQLDVGESIELSTGTLFTEEGHYYFYDKEDNSSSSSDEDVSIANTYEDIKLIVPIFTFYNENQDYKSGYVSMKIYNNKPGDLRKWLKEYVPNIVGISNDMYVLLHNYKNKFVLNNDIVRLLCEWILFQDVDMAYQQLLQC